MTWLHFLNDCAEIDKMLNASIQSLSTIHYPLFTKAVPPPHTTVRAIQGETGVFQTSSGLRPPRRGGSFEGETTDPCDRIGTWRGSGS